MPSDGSYRSRPASAYVHVPFCRHRCGYCNFTLIANRQDLVDGYLNCLAAELANTLRTPQRVRTLFVGGGTPSYLPADKLEHFLELISEWLPLEPDGEFSCEANPLDCTKQQLQLLRSGGVNRLSLGGQSFNDQKLRFLERDHSGAQLFSVIELAGKYFDNLSLDLIFAAAGETLADWQGDLAKALQTPIRHLSTYGLTIERGTQFFNRRQRGELTELDDDLQLGMYLHTIDTLRGLGWQHYEVSNFCQAEYQCHHNLAYWNSQAWWAFGPGAASFLPDDQEIDGGQQVDIDQHSKGDQHSIGSRQSDLAQQAVKTLPEWRPTWKLRTNYRSTTQYIKRMKLGLSPVAECEELDLEAWIRQRLVFGLRQMSGVDLGELDRILGRPARPLFEPFLSRYIDRNWLEIADRNLRLTRAGLVISDSLWPDLLAGS